MKKIHNQSIIKERRRITVGFIFNHSFFLGGGEISFFELIRKLDKKQFKPVVVVPASGEIERKLKYHNIEVHPISLPSVKKLWKISPLKALFNLTKLLKESEVDIIHNNGSRACFYSAIAGRIIKIPVIWHVRESIKDLLLYDWLLTNMANVIICVSKSVQLKRFARFGRHIDKKIWVIYNGIDTNKFQESHESRYKIRTQFSVKDSDILVGLIGNLIPRKAQDFFLKGFAKAKLIEPGISVKVLLVGHDIDKNFSKYLRQLVNDLGLQQNVIFRRFSDEIQNILSALDIFALTSKSEGFSRSLLEAMSCGLPIIATKISEIEEAIIDKSNGILVDFMDTKKMAFAIVKLCKNAKLRRDMGIRNKLISNKRFSLASHAKMVESLYFKVI